MAEKLRSTFKLNEEQLAALKQIIPEAFKDGLVDIGALSDALSDYSGEEALDIDDNLFGLYWPGKRDAKRAAAVPPPGTLVPVPGDGVDEETTRNIYIEGDNLEVLKIIRKAYSGKIKMIYIDPPYNTGKDFVYNDDFSETEESFLRRTGQIDDNNERTTTNARSDGRFHSKWCSMMYPRLRLVRDLLADNGVIFISIDDNEVAQLRKICDEIFGEGNFVTEFPRVTKKGGKSSDVTAKNHDYVLVYVMDKDNSDLIGVSHTDEGYNKKDGYYEKRGYYKANQTLDYDSLGYVKSLDYPIEINGEVFYAGGSMDAYMERQKGQHGRADWAWRWSVDLFNFGYENGFIEIHRGGVRPRIYTKTYQNVKIEKIGSQYKIKEFDRTKPLSTLEFSENKYSNDNAKKAFDELMKKSVFEYTKPPELIINLTKLVNNNDFIIIDFFSGSSTTAHAVMQLNAEDGGNRQFIMVQLQESCKEKTEAYKAGFKNICEIGKERIRLAGKKIKQEAGLNAKNLDTGFKVFRLAPSNIKQKKPYTGTDVKELSDWFSGEPLVEGWKTENLITEVMLKEGFPLDSTITTLEIYKKNKVFQISSDFCNHSLIICFDKNIENDTVEKLDLGELNIFICLDSAISDQVKARLDDKGRIITI